MENLFIYKISNNYDWYLFSYQKTEVFYFIIRSYEDFKTDILGDLEDFPSEKDFKIFSSSKSVKEKLAHYINSWYEYSGYFLINENNEVYYLSTEQLDGDELLLNKEETEIFLDGLITKLNLEDIFKKTQIQYLENKDEILSYIEEYKEQLKKYGMQDTYKETIHISNENY
jgi:hypothetical protein